MTERHPPCHGHEHEAAYISAIGELAEAMRGWIQRNPGAVLSWREVLSRRPVGLEEPGAVEALAATPDAERMLREVGAATAGNATLRMARIALGIVGQLRRLDVGVN
jgi:hypothetical protein